MKISATTLFLVLALPLISLAQEANQEQPAASVAPASEKTEAAAAETTAPATTPRAMSKPAAGAERPKGLDLRHCLDLGDNIAIARCAYE